MSRIQPAKGFIVLRTWILLFAFLTLGGCVGDMTGQVRGSGERVMFAYQQGLESDKYTAEISGEKFEGRAVMDGASTTTASVFGGDFTNTLFGQTTTNRFVAVLLGDKGSSLNCQMRYAASSGDTSSGGVGVCKHSDGRVIDVVW